MQFLKAHGLGNDYLAVDGAEAEGVLTPLAVRMLCDRHRGIGSDGILVAVPSEAAQFGLRIFNPDGGEAEKSGNGLRIYAAYLLDRGRVEIGREFRVETRGGLVAMTILARSAEGVLDIEAEMGRAEFRSAAVGLRGPDRDSEAEPLALESGERVVAAALSLGNPHCVVFVDELSRDELYRLGPALATHPLFEHGTNVQLARVAAAGAVDALVWERGAGETQASGSSACAVAAAALRRGLLAERRLAVRMPGGTLEVEVREDWSVRLRGPVEVVYRGELDAGLLRRLAV